MEINHTIGNDLVHDVLSPALFAARKFNPKNVLNIAPCYDDGDLNVFPKNICLMI